MIGGHGEGMKLGILRLEVCGHNVKYHTGRAIWKFFMKEARGAGVETLFYRTSDSKARRADFSSTTVYVSNVSSREFRLEDYLPLGNDVVYALPGSEYVDGYLLDSKNASLSSGRIYVKGIFVWKDNNLDVGVNFTNVGVNRDRELITHDRIIHQMLANVWKTLLRTALFLEDQQQNPSSSQPAKREPSLHTNSNKNANSSKHTSRFVDIFLEKAQSFPSSREARSLQFMGATGADLLLCHIRKKDSCAFPYEKGADAEKKLIVSSLGLNPYPCSKSLLQLLMTHDDVMTVHEAQEKMFLADSASSDENVNALPLARMLRSCVTEISKGNVSLRFQKGQKSNIQALLRDNTLVCSETLVVCTERDKSEMQRAAIKAIIAAERELAKNMDPAEIERITYGMRSFTVKSLSSFLPEPEVQDNDPNWNDNISESNASNFDMSEDVPGSGSRPPLNSPSSRRRRRTSGEDMQDTGDSNVQEHAPKRLKCSQGIYVRNSQ